MSAVHFPKGFALGAASAATQIDGDCKESNWYEWYKNGKIKDNSCLLYTSDAADEL